MLASEIADLVASNRGLNYVLSAQNGRYKQHISCCALSLHVRDTYQWEPVQAQVSPRKEQQTEWGPQPAQSTKRGYRISKPL